MTALCNPKVSAQQQSLHSTDSFRHLPLEKQLCLADESAGRSAPDVSEWYKAMYCATM